MHSNSAFVQYTSRTVEGSTRRSGHSNLVSAGAVGGHAAEHAALGEVGVESQAGGCDGALPCLGSILNTHL